MLRCVAPRQKVYVRFSMAQPSTDWWLPANPSPFQETKMLSPHEIAALMLLDSANENLDLDPIDLKTLVRRQLVQLDRPVHDRRQVRLTKYGRSFLNNVARRG